VLLPLLTLAIWLTLGAGSAGPARQICVGAVIGLATLVRPTALILLPLAALAFFRSGGRPAQPLARAGTVVASTLFVLSPVVLIGARTTGSPLLLQGNGGLNFYIGNSPQGTGLPTIRPRAGWDRLETEAQRKGIRRPKDQDRYFLHKTFVEISQSPSQFLR